MGSPGPIIYMVTLNFCMMWVCSTVILLYSSSAYLLFPMQLLFNYKQGPPQSLIVGNHALPHMALVSY